MKGKQHSPSGGTPERKLKGCSPGSRKLFQRKVGNSNKEDGTIIKPSSTEMKYEVSICAGVQ